MVVVWIGWWVWLFLWLLTTMWRLGLIVFWEEECENGWKEVLCIRLANDLYYVHDASRPNDRFVRSSIDVMRIVVVASLLVRTLTLDPL